MREYPKIIQGNLEEIRTWADFVTEQRTNDVTDFDEVQNRFAGMRKVARIPTATNNVLDTDREGDFTFDNSYMYIATNNGGTLQWNRIALTTW